MKLREYEGKELFRKYGIEPPKGELINSTSSAVLKGPVVLKAQVLSGDRKKHGGIIITKESDIGNNIAKLLGREINGEVVEKILVEELIDIAAEYYASISYDTVTRGPVLALNVTGGSGIEKAETFPLDILEATIPEKYLETILIKTGFPASDIAELSKIIQNLWQLFIKEYALLAEINPIFKTKSGHFVAGDAKVILDDEKINPNERRFVSMGGDIAILASGGGASMLNMDALLHYGGKPANYTEYSGNPKGEVVKELTKRVLSQPGINGLWVIGGTANFTDVFETLSGFVEGLESLPEKPKYPIVIRRDGPRQKEAAEMLKIFAAEKGYDMHIYDREMPMEQSAKLMVQLANEFARKSKI